MKKHSACGFVAVVCLVGLVGCGGGKPQPFANSVPVSGTVTFQGQPLAQGVVRLVPADDKGQPVTGAIKDGKFSLNTTVSSPGVVVGKYKVCVISNREKAPPPPGPDGSSPLDETKPESLIPTRYAKGETSGLEVDVQAGLKPLVYELQE